MQGCIYMMENINRVQQGQAKQAPLLVIYYAIKCSEGLHPKLVIATHTLPVFDRKTIEKAT